jgi:hypothetical protein
MITGFNIKQEPLRIVGSNHYGRYPKISVEQTINMIISDNALVPNAGYERKALISQNGVGRGLFASNRYNHMIAVIDNGVYAINSNISYQKIGELETYNSPVFIDENNVGQIGLCDQSSIYVFDYINSTFQKASLDFIPGYIAFQNSRFIAPESTRAVWRLSNFNDGLDWPVGASYEGTFQTKSDIPLACTPFPGKGNLLFIYGSQVGESWFNAGQNLFPYVKNTYFNLSYGTTNAETIALGDNIIVWVGKNNNSQPVILFSEGADPKQISNDGIDYQLSQLQNPEDSFGFLYKQDGHLLYQVTFKSDNLTLLYDFNTQSFFTLTDEYMNYHIARQVVSFNNTHYFVSANDGGFYELNTNITTYNGVEIPRIRVCNPIRFPDSRPRIFKNAQFTIEQGIDTELAKVQISISKNGGETFSNFYSKHLNHKGKFKNRLQFDNLGAANDFTAQFRFIGFGRFVAMDGIVEYSE